MRRNPFNAALVFLVIVLSSLGCTSAGAQSANEINELSARSSRLYGEGKYAEAAEVAKRVVAIAEKQQGADHPRVGTELNNLAIIYQAQGRYTDAEPLYKRSLTIAEKALGPEHAEVGIRLNNLALLYRDLGRYAEAEPLSRRSLAITEKALGPAHPEVAVRLNNLALLCRDLGRYAEAEPLYQRALAITEKAQGPDHPAIGNLLNNIAELKQVQGRLAEAEPLYKRALAIGEKALGSDHPEVGSRLNNLGYLYHLQGRFIEAEPLYKRSLSIAENALGPDHPDVGNRLNNLANLYRVLGRLAESEVLYQRAVANGEKALGPDHVVVGSRLNDLANLHQMLGRHAEAELLSKRALVIAEKALGPDHLQVGIRLNNLASIYQAQGRGAEAEPLYKRSLTIAEKALGPEHAEVGIRLNNLALLYRDLARHTEAEPLFRRSLAITEKALGPDHPEVAVRLNNLALLHRDLNRYAEAEPLYQRALAITEKAQGPDHPMVGDLLNNIADLERLRGRFAEAEPLYKRALAIGERALGPDHPEIAGRLNNLAALYLAQREWKRATDIWRQSTSLTIRRTLRGTDDVGEVLTGRRRGEAEQLSYRFRAFVKVAHRLAGDGQGSDVGLSSEMFETAQWAQGSEAAISLTQMAARGAKGDPALAALVRERQDLVEEWQRRDGARNAAVAQVPDKRDRVSEAANLARLSDIDTRIADIDRRLARDFPEYAALTRPVPQTVAEVQAQLGGGEALVLFLDTQQWQPIPEETFIWVVTKTDMRWVKSELGTPALSREVAALRCGLDAAAWEDEGAAKCAGLLRLDNSRGYARLPFDIARAHALYQSLFGQVEDLIKGKQLLIVPSGPLTALPFQVLVTAASTATPNASANEGGEYGSAAWIIHRHAITVLPSVASLKWLRQFAKASKASRPFVGFGNPLLAGPDGTDRRAWARQSCRQIAAEPARLASRRMRGQASRFFRGADADVELIRSQAPLPETADELCAVARSLGAKEDSVYLGEKATETTIKGLSASGALAQSRVVHFATHGLLAKETGFVTASKVEPALILTPPAKPSEDDDGLLTSSEVAQLKLDADWVVLSACNTAAGGTDDLNAQALSGLARAFFYAGARALLVSHWAVDSGATVNLITKVFEEIKADAKLGRAEGLRRSMLALIGSGRSYSHPASWAPFIVVGEGAGAR